MPCYLVAEDIPVTPSAELLAKLLGSWDPITKTYAKMSDMMTLMQTAINLGGGPVHGINWTSRVREISKNLAPHLGGKPSVEAVFVACECLYDVQQYIRTIMQEDPGLGGLGLDQAARHEEFLLRLNNFCDAANNNNSHHSKKEMSNAGRHKHMPQLREATGPIGGMPPPTLPPTTLPPHTLPPTTLPPHTLPPPTLPPPSFETHPTKRDRPFQVNSVSSKRVKSLSNLPTSNPLRNNSICSNASTSKLLELLSESMLQRNRVEIATLKCKQKELEFNIRVKKINMLEEKLKATEKCSPLWKTYEEKLKQLINEL